MQREGERRAAAGQAGRRVGPVAGHESGNRPASAVLRGTPQVRREDAICDGVRTVDELTKDFTPARWARIEAMVAEMDEVDRRREGSGPAALEPQEQASADKRPPRHAPEGR